MDIKDILARCDHTLLRTDCTAAEIRALCDDAIRFGCASVCIPPAHVAGAKRYVNGRMKICTVIGFPNGYNTTAAKVFETEDAVKNGADEVKSVGNSVTLPADISDTEKIKAVFYALAESVASRLRAADVGKCTTVHITVKDEYFNEVTRQKKIPPSI